MVRLESLTSRRFRGHRCCWNRVGIIPLDLRYGVPGRVRTCNLRLRRALRYPVVPRGLSLQLYQYDNDTDTGKIARIRRSVSALCAPVAEVPR